VDVVVLEELAEQLKAATFHHPRRLLTAVEAERYCGVEGERRVLANEVVGAGVADFNRAILDRIHHARARDDLTGRENLDLELAAGGCSHPFGHHIGAAVDGVEGFREAGSQAPLDGGQLGGQGGGCHCTGGYADTGLLDE